MPQPSSAILIRHRSPSRVAAITMRVPSALYRIALSSTFMRISSNKAGFAFTSRSASAIRVRIIRLPTLGRTRWIATPTILATLKVCEDAGFPPAHPDPAGRETSTGYRRGHSVGFTPRLIRCGGSTTREGHDGSVAAVGQEQWAVHVKSNSANDVTLLSTAIDERDDASLHMNPIVTRSTASD